MQADHIAFGVDDEGDIPIAPDREFVAINLAASFNHTPGFKRAVGTTER